MILERFRKSFITGNKDLQKEGNGEEEMKERFMQMVKSVEEILIDNVDRQFTPQTSVNDSQNEVKFPLSPNSSSNYGI